MNKTTRIALVAVPLALAYPAAAWLIGMQVETAIARNYDLIADNPSLQIVDRDYRRRLFGATETLTLELFANLTQLATQQRQQALAANPGMTLPPVRPMRVTVRSEIRHGPLPGLSTFAAAVVDSELVLDDALGAQLTGLFGEQKPLQTHTVYRFDGGGVSTLSSPPFSTYWPAAEGAGQNTLAWDGLTMSVDFERGLRRYALRAEAPRLEFKASRGGQATLLGMRLEGAQQRIFEDDPLLYGGTHKLSLARITVGGEDGGEPVEMRRAHYEAEVPLKGDFIDLIGRFGSESLRIAGTDYGPARYDVSVRHVHARTMAKLYREAMRISADAEMQAAAQTSPGQLLAPLAGPALELLGYDPEISIDRLSFRTPHGDAVLSARVKLNAAQAQDFANPLLLLAKLDAGVDLHVPEAFVGEIAVNAMPAIPAGAGGELPAAPTDEVQPSAEEGVAVADAALADLAARREILRQRIAGLVAQGLLVREGGELRAQLAVRDGGMTVNGQPFNPLAIGTPAAGR